MFVTLFRGRGDVYGAWDGGCVRVPLLPRIFKEHLDGKTLIGIYPALNVEGVTKCVWGCTDIDYDQIEHPLAIKDALHVMGVQSWLEKTRKGYHLWVFAEELVPARDMRRMFLAAHQVADVPAKEVNPKQEHLAHGQVGNYVRLPYPGGLQERRVWVDGKPVHLDWFASNAFEQRTPADKIADLASYWKPPAPVHQITAAPTQDMAEAARRLSLVGRAIFRDGPLPDRDRSSTLFRLAHECRDAGLAPEDCRILMEDADLRWGKYLARGATGQIELDKLIFRAYGTAASST
jgi:hypothetical protein